MEKILSIFVDESGDTGFAGDTSKYYIVSFVFHDQSDDISSQLGKVKNELPFHVGPIIRKEYPYEEIDINERAKLLRKILVWSTILPVRTKSFVYTKKDVDYDYRKLLMKLARDIYAFLDCHRDFFSMFSKLIVYKNVICKRVMNYFDFIASFESNVSL